MWTLSAIVTALTGGASAVLGTAVWLGLILARRVRGVPARVNVRDLRWVWGVSAFLGVPLLFPWMPAFMVAAGQALMPYFYVACIGLLAANVSIGIGTGLYLAVVYLARLFRLVGRADVTVASVRWQLTVVWAVSAVIGIPVLYEPTSALVDAIAVGALASGTRRF
jgi:hypothetical protein